MTKGLAPAAYSLIEHRALVAGEFLFNPELRVSKKSRFEDGRWDWTIENNLRLKVTRKAKLCIDWTEITLGANTQRSNSKIKLHPLKLFRPALHEEIVEDLKRAFFIAASFPSLLSGDRKREKKPITIVNEIRLCVNFLSHLCSESLLPNRFARIKRLSDVRLADIQRSIETFPYFLGRLKSLLMFLAGETIQGNFKHGRLQWSSQDIKMLHWPPTKEGGNIATLPDRLFALLSNSSADLVLEFHLFLGNDTRDTSTESASLKVKQRAWPRFTEMYKSYLHRREIIRTRGRKWVSNHTVAFVREFGVKPRTVREFLSDVQTAAFQIILLYTGMRYSEAASLQRGCLVVRDGITLIKSTLIKNEPSNLPIDQDEWVAIAIVQDAVRALEELNRCNFNNFLFSKLATLRENEDENPISNGQLSERLNLYLKKIDKHGVWSDWQLSPHQYRHGLVHQLARAEIGIPYITRQLKHYHSLLSERSYRINPTSTIYGMQRQRLVSNATGLRAIKNANAEVANDLYGEGRRFAGGGAALHIKRTEAFFRGIGLEGKARKEYIERFSESGGTEIRTGVGLCLRNHVDPQKLKEDPPPCIGDLNCNPHTCTHSVVPESRKAEVIARYRNAAKQLAAPDQSHLTSHWEAELRAYAAMLEQLGVDSQNLPSAVVSPDTIARVLAAN